jgi:hypothetical protein
MVDCYSIRIHYRASRGSEREKAVLECAKEYQCEPDCHLIDRLLDDRLKLFEHHKTELARVAQEEARLAEEKRKLMGG